MSRLTKLQSDSIKRGQNWRCGNKKCPYGTGGLPASIKSGGHIHHKDGNPKNNNISNLVALCRKCHAKIKNRGDAIDRFDKRWGL